MNFLKVSERGFSKMPARSARNMPHQKPRGNSEKYRKDRDKNYISDFDMAVKKYLRQGKGQSKDKK